MLTLLFSTTLPYLCPQRVPALGNSVTLGADPARHDVRVGELSADVLDARQSLVAVVLNIVL